jgi:hypothetical protein
MRLLERLEWDRLTPKRRTDALMPIFHDGRLLERRRNFAVDHTRSEGQRRSIKPDSLLPAKMETDLDHRAIGGNGQVV